MRGRSGGAVEAPPVVRRRSEQLVAANPALLTGPTVQDLRYLILSMEVKDTDVVNALNVAANAHRWVLKRLDIFKERVGKIAPPNDAHTGPITRFEAVEARIRLLNSQESAGPLSCYYTRLAIAQLMQAAYTVPVRLSAFVYALRDLKKTAAEIVSLHRELVVAQATFVHRYQRVHALYARESSGENFTAAEIHGFTAPPAILEPPIPAFEPTKRTLDEIIALGRSLCPTKEAIAISTSFSGGGAGGAAPMDQGSDSEDSDSDSSEETDDDSAEYGPKTVGRGKGKGKQVAVGKGKGKEGSRLSTLSEAQRKAIVDAIPDKDIESSDSDSDSSDSDSEDK